MADDRPAPHQSKRYRPPALAALGFFISGVALYFVFRGEVELENLTSTVSRIHVGYLVLSVVLYWGGVGIIRSFLIRHLLSSVGEVRKAVAFRYFCIGFLANNILPLKMGEAVRTGGIAKRSNISFASAAGSLLLERLMDLTMAAVIGVIAIQVAPIPNDLRIAILTAGGVLVGVLLLLALIARRGLKETTSLRYGRLVRFAWNLIARFTTGFGGLQSSRKVILTVILSALLWGVATGTLVLRLMAFGFPPSVPMALVLMASISLSIAIPAMPSAVGVYHAFAVGALMIMGVDKELAIAFAVFSHLSDVIPSSTLGAVCMAIEGMGWSELTARAKPAE